LFTSIPAMIQIVGTLLAVMTTVESVPTLTGTKARHFSPWALEARERFASPSLSCPFGCLTYYNGCNSCKCDEQGAMVGCTRRACFALSPPKCLEYRPRMEPSPRMGCPYGCLSYYNGCNWCKCDGQGAMGVCTLRFCERRGPAKCLKYDPMKERWPLPGLW